VHDVCPHFYVKRKWCGVGTCRLQQHTYLKQELRQKGVKKNHSPHF